MQRYIAEKIINLKTSEQRGVLICVGEQVWLRQTLAIVDDLVNSEQVLRFNLTAPENDSQTTKQNNKQNQKQNNNVDSKSYRHQLGREYGYLWFNGGGISACQDMSNTESSLTASFHVDAFAALTGTLVKGALSVVFLSAEQVSNSLFLKRMLAISARFSEIDVIEQHQALDIDKLRTNCHTTLASNTSKAAPVKLPFSCKTEEQVDAVNTIEQVLLGHRDRPLVISADRGRGKSTALAIAAAKILTKGDKHIVVTAPHPDSLQIFYQQLKQHLPDARQKQHGIEYGDSRIEFIPVDVLLRQKVSAAMVLVDEAAGIPVPLLVQLLADYHRIVFASTIHGYEGAGRGFSQKFMALLRQQKPQHRHLHMQQPIRWRDDDMLERFSFDSFLLAATLPEVADDFTELTYHHYQAKQLYQDDELLSQIFSLLVCAHYQTKPSDLKLLLDDEHVHLLVVKADNLVCGVSLMLAEGELDDALIRQIKLGKRRPKGHLLPQSLLAHGGFEQAFEYRYLRIVRIAVLPCWQNRGIGANLLGKCLDYSRNQSFDFLCSSFGVNAPLLKFWQNAGFSMARLGFSRDKASGEHSAMVLQALNKRSEEFAAQISSEFYINFHYYLAEEFSALASELTSQILVNKRPHSSVDISPSRDNQIVAKFVVGAMVYSSCAASLSRWLKTNFADIHSDKITVISDQDKALLMGKLWQRRSFSDIAEQIGLTGKKAAYKKLQQVIRSLYLHVDSLDESAPDEMIARKRHEDEL
ncbi:GNAT family N-acetyltransferase [Thalassotalea sp. Y01]|uniref:GNAT family N-acetyltransferase n=1 Tax=Thalassotalea sp. Y01 TaxID=2729613 RepID=UPI00145D583E|nr:tRNA(Met) cytidine acetyltransferase [Thalassotalea sp. Y01]